MTTERFPLFFFILCYSECCTVLRTLRGRPSAAFFILGRSVRRSAKSFRMSRSRNTVFCRVLAVFLAPQPLYNEHFQEVPASVHSTRLAGSVKPFRIRTYEKRGEGEGLTKRPGSFRLRAFTISNVSRLQLQVEEESQRKRK